MSETEFKILKHGKDVSEECCLVKYASNLAHNGVILMANPQILELSPEAEAAGYTLVTEEDDDERSGSGTGAVSPSSHRGQRQGVRAALRGASARR